MPTLQQRVEDYVGSITDTDALGQWLREGVLTVASAIPEPKLRQYAAEIGLEGDDPVDTNDIRVLGFVREGKQCILVPMEYEGRITDPHSFFYATASAPVALVKNGLAYIYPAGGYKHVVGYFYPIPQADFDRITPFPPEYEGIVILHAAIRFKGMQIEELRSISWPTEPPTPDYTALYTQLHTYLDTEQDIELAQAKMNEIQLKMQEHNTAVNAYVAKVQTQVQKLTVEKLALENLRLLYMDAWTQAFGKGPTNVPA